MKIVSENRFSGKTYFIQLVPAVLAAVVGIVLGGGASEGRFGGRGGRGRLGRPSRPVYLGHRIGSVGDAPVAVGEEFVGGGVPGV